MAQHGRSWRRAWTPPSAREPLVEPGRGRGAVLVPAPAVVAADAGVAGAGHGGGGGVGPGALGAAAGHGRAGPVAAAAGNGAGVGRGRGAAAPAGNPLGRWLVGNTNHGDNSQKLPSFCGFAIDPKELEIYSADEYLTGDPEVDDLYLRLASLFNSHGDKRVLTYEKGADGKLSRTDELEYKKDKERFLEQTGELQAALLNHHAKAYPIPKIFKHDPPF